MNKRISVWLAIIFFIAGLVEVAIFIDSSKFTYLFLSFTMFSFVVLHLINAYKKCKTP